MIEDLISRRVKYLDDGLQASFKKVFGKDLKDAYTPFLRCWHNYSELLSKFYYSYRNRVFLEITESLSIENASVTVTIESCIPEKKYVHKIDGMMVFTDSYRLKKD